jgi:hypothetical protein
MAKKEQTKTSQEPEANWSGRKFRRKPEIVEAVQTPSGLWEILSSDIGVESRCLYEDEEFRSRFEPVTDQKSETESN